MKMAPFKRNNLSVRINTTISLQCNATGTPSPRLRWIRNTSRAQADEVPLSYSTHSLHLHTLEYADTGHYCCIAEQIYLENPGLANLQHIYQLECVNISVTI